MKKLGKDTVRILKSTIAGVVALSVGGCATLIHGSSQSIPVTTDPPGATLSVNGSQYVSPVDLSLDRNKGYQLVASKEGYVTKTTEIRSQFSAVTFIDLIFLIPWAVDLADGAAYTLSPESIQLTLEPVKKETPVASQTPGAAQSPVITQK